MKRIILTAMLTAGIIAGAAAQKGKLNEAKSSYQNYYAMANLKQTEEAAKSLNEAKTAIEEVVVHEKTQGEPEAYLYKSLIYSAMANDSTMQDASTDAIQISYDALKKAKELDQENELKEEDLTTAEQNLYVASYNKGINAYNDQSFETALKYFKVATDVNPTDTTLYLNTGVTAEKMGDTALAIQSYAKLAELGYKDPAIYAVLANLYFRQNQEEEALGVLKRGLDLFPGNKDLMITELNYHLEKGEASKQIDKIEASVEADPGNKALWYALGVAYNEIDSISAAEDAYKKALEIDPNYYEANINMGVIAIDRANQVIQEANAIPQNKAQEYEAKIAEYKEALKGALVFLEKAYQ
ncbi:MAG TPA: tetratricopeptide repeat protein, partial [Anseongella sp.]|nr:tetratricopeptide repeat protein [Anseongella sp.]